MGLDKKATGNPNFYKGMPSANPAGRPKGGTKKQVDVRSRVLGKWQTNPVDKLVILANRLEASNPEFSAKIWIRLLDAIEEEQKKKKGGMSPIIPSDEPTDDTTNEEELLAELENDGRQTETSSENPSVAQGATPLSPEASTETDLSGHPEE